MWWGALRCAGIRVLRYSGLQGFWLAGQRALARWGVCGVMLAAVGAAAHAQERAAPGSFEAIAYSPTEIRCFWLPAAGAVGYRIMRDGQTVADLPADAREYADTGLAPDTTYRYAAQARFASGESPVREYVERTFAPFPTPEARRDPRFDVIVVQASSSGVAAAIEAGRRGYKVALIEPTTRLGGMPVNGLSATDLRREPRASGFLTRFRDRVKALYAAEGITTNGLRYEPRMAHQAMKSLLYETPNLSIFRRARLTGVQVSRYSPLQESTALDSPSSALQAPERPQYIESITIEELSATGEPTGRKARLTAKIFVDATDCGDLAAWAGAPYRLGREPRSKAEPHNGVIYYDRQKRIPLPGSTGEGDRRIQSYAYLFAVKDYGPDADKTIPKPPGYNRENYVLTPEWRKSWAVTDGHMPNRKYEINQHPQGSDLQEINYGYPTGDYRERARVERLYRDHVLGYLYYIQTEQGQKQLGLPDDEYRDSEGFPPLLYVREGRRILGEQLPVEADITNARRLIRPESIGIGDYPMDSHAVRFKPSDWPQTMGEGEWWLFHLTPWYEIPYGVMVPQRLDNLLVTTAVSSTHVSYGTYRMEPVRMAFGQAAGIAAALGLRYRLTPRQVPVRQIQLELLPSLSNPYGDPGIQLYHLPDLKPDHPHYRAIQYLLVRGFLPDFPPGAGEPIAGPPRDANFEPEKPVTRGELGRWLAFLAARGFPREVTKSEAKRIEAQVGRGLALRPGTPFFATEVTDIRPALELLAAAGAEQPVTREEFAVHLARVRLPNPLSGAIAARPRYADLANVEASRSAWIERLGEYGLDARLWDGLSAVAPDGRLFFQPDRPLTRAEAFAALYLAQIGLGPTFFENPVDARNGRAVTRYP